MTGHGVRGFVLLCTGTGLIRSGGGFALTVFLGGAYLAAFFAAATADIPEALRHLIVTVTPSPRSTTTGSGGRAVGRLAFNARTVSTTSARLRPSDTAAAATSACSSGLSSLPIS